jgi:hypothetical protein
MTTEESLSAAINDFWHSRRVPGLDTDRHSYDVNKTWGALMQELSKAEHAEKQAGEKAP